jgi:uncharacterized repeat protein (TIGR03803 family)
MRRLYLQRLSRRLLFALLFSSAIAATAATKQTLHSFSLEPNGANPYAPLVEDSAGDLYGVASGGAYGVVFKLARGKNGAWKETVIHNFTGGTDGSYPDGPLVVDGVGNLYGATGGGGTYNLGTVFKLAPGANGWQETILHNFAPGYVDGSNPHAVIMDGAGNLYGTTYEGGNSSCERYYTWIGCGIVFELSPQSNGTWTESVLYNFQDNNNGANPISPLVMDKAGNLYGTTASGGLGCYDNYTCGLLFELSKGSTGAWAASIVYEFTFYAPPGIAIDSQGNLYTYGISVMQFTPSSTGTWTENNIYTFTSAPSPSGVPVFDSAGNLYGTTGNYYNSLPGTIFKLTPNSSGNWTESTLYTFTGGADAAAPNTPLLDTSGNIYVAAVQGGEVACPIYYNQYALGPCGTVFELSPNSSGGWTGTTLYEFAPGPTDGAGAMAGLVADAVGNFYGTTQWGGSSGAGSVYKATLGQNGKWTSSVIYSFTGTNGDGSEPTGSLIFDSPGNLYGTTQWGGASKGGTVFKLAPSSNGSWTETVLYSFVNSSGSTDGYGPNAGLIFDSQGNLYGSTGNGGANNGCGTVFKLAPSSGSTWTETLLYTFTITGGCYYGSGSSSAVVFDQQGNLYGINGRLGIAFKLSPPSGSGTQWTETTLHTFTGGTDGSYPVGGVVLDAEGNVYGTSSYAGSYGGGQVFKLAAGTWAKTAIHNFTGLNGDGSNPESTLVFDSAGNLYGTTVSGGPNGCNQCGTVFELSPSGGGYRESILHSFTGGSDGNAPYASLVLDSHGDLYGTTSTGGAGALGTVFKITP